MTLLAFGMDLLLASLLLAAVIVGVRLNGRLKGLREGHGQFVAAVADLDAAAAKAERALGDLKAASEDAHDALMARIETARALTRSLEVATADAQKSARRAQDSEPAPPPPAVFAPAVASAAVALEVAGTGAHGDQQAQAASSKLPRSRAPLSRVPLSRAAPTADLDLPPLGERRRALEARFPPSPQRGPARAPEEPISGRPSPEVSARLRAGGEDELFQDGPRSALRADRSAGFAGGRRR